MFKTRFISMLVLLMTAVTGAWADTTVTWTEDDMSKINIDFSDGYAENNAIKGITVTSSGEVMGVWDGTNIKLMEDGSTTITFTSSVGDIKSIAIMAEMMMNETPSGWTKSDHLSWSGDASPTVSMTLSGELDIYDISEIVFTIESPTVNVTGITLDKTEASMIVGGDALTLTATVAPDDATDKSVTWSSSNEAVATVTDGVVTAVAAGTATITVTTTDGAKTATCAVTVAAPAASTYTVTLKEDTEDATSWTIAPAEATTTGVAAGTEVKATYSGMKKVKSVKAKKKAAAAPALNLTSPAVGQVIGSDGKNYDYASLPTGVTKVAMIAYVSGSNGLAIALADEGEMNWTTAKSTCEAKTPAFTGGTWKLPTQDEWKQMFSANGGDEESCSGLNTAIVNAGGEALQEEVDQYWSSSEEDEDLAWYVRLSDGDTLWDNYDKSGDFHVRACLAF